MKRGKEAWLRLPLIPSEARDLAWEWIETGLPDPSLRSG